MCRIKIFQTWKHKQIGKIYLTVFELKFFHASCSSQVGPTWNSHENSYNMIKYLVLYNKIYETHHLQWLYGARDTVIMYGNQSVSKISSYLSVMLFSANLPTSAVVHKFSSWNKAYYHNYYKQILCFSLKYSKANYHENIAKSPYRQILSMLNLCVHRMRCWFRMIPYD